MGCFFIHNTSNHQRCNMFANIFIGFFVIGICALRQFGVQATVLLTIDHLSADMVDPKYFEPKDTKAFIDDEEESTLSMRFNVIKPIPERGEGHLTVFGLSMGEFIMPTGMDLVMKIRDIIDEPIALGPILKKMGFVSGEGPVPAGVYEMKQYKVPVDNFPDEFIENKYKTKFEISVDGQLILSIQAIVDVENLLDR